MERNGLSRKIISRQAPNKSVYLYSYHLFFSFLQASVSRQIRQHVKSLNLPRKRPSDWFSVTNCGLQYQKMQDSIISKETPKRKRGGAAAAAAATPSSSSSPAVRDRETLVQLLTKTKAVSRSCVQFCHPFQRRNTHKFLAPKKLCF